MNVPFTIGKLLVISPHLDDAVFSCGELIAQNAGSLVATVFCGVPLQENALTEWDAASGFLNASEAMSQRRQEDYSALHLLSAVPLWLDFYDSQYNIRLSSSALAAALSEAVQQHHPDTVLFPAGLFHSDHLMVHRAMLAIRADYPDKNWIMYEDAIYRRIPGALQQRLTALMHADIEVTPLEISSTESAHIKKQAVHCYSSQLQALSRTVQNGVADAFALERYWRLEPQHASDINARANV
jgi:LmbE family N-acetylglucosaminyl deacetylase